MKIDEVRQRGVFFALRILRVKRKEENGCLNHARLNSYSASRVSEEDGGLSRGAVKEKRTKRKKKKQEQGGNLIAARGKGDVMVSGAGREKESFVFRR